MHSFYQVIAANAALLTATPRCMPKPGVPREGCTAPMNDTRTGRLEISTATVRECLGYTSRRRISQLATASSSTVHRQRTPKPCHGESRSLAS
jgi:hypothetical protein